MTNEPYYRFIKGNGWCLGYWDFDDMIDAFARASGVPARYLYGR